MTKLQEDLCSTGEIIDAGAVHEMLPTAARRLPRNALAVEQSNDRSRVPDPYIATCTAAAAIGVRVASNPTQENAHMHVLHVQDKTASRRAMDCHVFEGVEAHHTFQ